MSANLLFASSAICLYATLHFFISGIQPQDRRLLLFSMLCLVTGLYVAGIYASYQAISVAEMAFALKFQISFGLIFVSILPWFVSELTKRRNIVLNTSLSCIALLLTAVNLLQPYSVQFSEIIQVQQSSLPWGETISVPVGTKSLWLIPTALFIEGVIIFGAIRFFMAYRRNTDGPFLWLATANATLALSVAQGIIVRLLELNFIHLPAFGYLAMIVVMSLVLTRDWRSRIVDSQARFRHLVQQSPYSIVQMSAKGAVQEVNPAFEKLWGVKSDAIIGYDLTSDKQLNDKGIVPHIRKALQGTACELPPIVYNPAINTEVPGPVNNRIVRGLIYPIKDNTGHVQEVILLQEDITERLRTEADREKLQAQLAQAEKMEAVGLLAGGIAHDFNNILGIILGYAELFRMQKQGSENNSEKSEYVKEIFNAGTRGRELIQQMMMFSRSGSSTTDGEIPITSVQPVIKEVMGFLRSTIPATIKLSYQISDPALKVRIQPVQLHQILLNLAINARDAVTEYGKIEISLSRSNEKNICASCNQELNGDYVELNIRDNGYGISSDLRTKIFDPFFTTKEIGKGTGIGLSVVNKAVHSVNGHILLESASNSGTTVRILLPSFDGPEALSVEQTTHEIPNLDDVLTGIRIMVIDDELAMTSMLHALFSIYGASVTTYNQTTQALSAFKLNPYAVDLVITDEAIPELSGFDLSKQMLNIRPDLPIVLCTGYSENINEHIAEEAGISGFLTKPLNIENLVSIVTRLSQKTTSK